MTDQFSKNNEVTKEVFDKFIERYPFPLKTDYCAIFEPPVLSYNDFSNGKVWPESVVAFIRMNKAWGESNEYFIKGRSALIQDYNIDFPKEE